MGPRRIARPNVAARAMNHDALAVPKTKQMTAGVMWHNAAVGFRMNSNTKGGCERERLVAK
jgi:hypothetical protein